MIMLFCCCSELTSDLFVSEVFAHIRVSLWDKFDQSFTTKSIQERKIEKEKEKFSQKSNL